MWSFASLKSLALDNSQVQSIFAGTDPDGPKEAKPYYHVQREFSGKLIVEALRFEGWKLRPAARLLGISPVKLRQDLKTWIEWAFEQSGTKDLDRVASRLGIPAETLKRKLDDLGLSFDSETTSDPTTERETR